MLGLIRQISLSLPAGIIIHKGRDKVPKLHKCTCSGSGIKNKCFLMIILQEKSKN